MLAYKNTEYTKDQAVELAQKHFDADNFIQGTFWTDNGKGCSVGCMVHAKKKNRDWHQATEPLFGIPRVLSRMQDRIFEGLPLDEAKKWTVRFISSIPDGADLSLAVPRLMHWLMTDTDGIRKHASTDGLKAIELVASLYERKLKGENVTSKEWLSVRDFTWEVKRNAAADAAAAAYAAADAAAYAAAAAAAYAAADAAAAAYAAADAAAAAAADAAAAAARQKQWIKTADKMIEILKSCPVKSE